MIFVHTNYNEPGLLNKTVIPCSDDILTHKITININTPFTHSLLHDCITKLTYHTLLFKLFKFQGQFKRYEFKYQCILTMTFFLDDVKRNYKMFK